MFCCTTSKVVYYWRLRNIDVNITTLQDYCTANTRHWCGHVNYHSAYHHPPSPGFRTITYYVDQFCTAIDRLLRPNKNVAGLLNMDQANNWPSYSHPSQYSTQCLIVLTFRDIYCMVSSVACLHGWNITDLSTAKLAGTSEVAIVLLLQNVI